MSGRGRARGAAAPAGRTRTVQVLPLKKAVSGGRAAGAGALPKTLNERFSQLASPKAKGKAAATQRVANARFVQVCWQPSSACDGAAARYAGSAGGGWR